MKIAGYTISFKAISEDFSGASYFLGGGIATLGAGTSDIVTNFTAAIFVIGSFASLVTEFSKKGGGE